MRRIKNIQGKLVHKTTSTLFYKQDIILAVNTLQASVIESLFIALKLHAENH